MSKSIEKTDSNKPKEVKVKKRGRIASFFKNVWNELKKVHWPTRKQVINYTGVVIAAVLLMAVVLSVFDWVISLFVGLIIA